MAVSFNVTAPTVLKASPGTLARLNVITAGSAPGSANDSATTGGAGAANQFFAIPNVIGEYHLDWVCVHGIVVTPGTGQAITVLYF